MSGGNNAGTFITYDLSGMLGLSSAQQLQYRTYWNIFEMIQATNYNISTARSAGDRSQAYYSFVSYAEQNDFTIGRFLHVQRYPNSNWALVPKD
jgi:hypothetical protein